MLVREIMTSPAYSVHEDTNLEAALKLMATARVTSLIGAGARDLLREGPSPVSSLSLWTGANAGSGRKSSAWKTCPCALLWRRASNG